MSARPHTSGTRSRGGASRASQAAFAVAVSNESGARLPVSGARLGDAARAVLRAEGVQAAMLSVTLLDARAMARLNRHHLGHAGATDVISFGFRGEPHRGVVGDVYICPAVARTNAMAHRVGVREELVRLVVHGTLHVLGHDHPVDASRTESAMWRRQERLVARLVRAAAPKVGPTGARRRAR